MDEASRTLISTFLQLISSWYSPPLILFSLLLFYHTFEASYAFLTNRREFGWVSFLISKPYAIAMTVGFSEFFIEAYFFRSLTLRLLPLSYVGILAACTGLLIRFGAMLQNTTGFTHLISTKKRDDHALVTTGFYAICRHPAYMGWFLFSVASQIILCNPVSFIAYAFVSWKFFANRIPYEEVYLRQFFGHQYAAYAKRTWSGIPFV
ncbi:Isoprenylcysteine carboxyl methyltransferase [Carpediemonas membranifera]|uniref:Protein-S-isoprenylcysteine O-methyltransferase n=1 Tax=Carpediemonas membranifera TaxID=201153 RepID=A0A8J6BCX2_9EUKA|nr:Isoprenylcysteine carboxyl methyltransferase [Carpediemonas membranifera]|eukprot:KAG9397577.1 Isoprenylcysteine carboxyl methyltransferase [Carpediemonas membranifera]